MTVLSNTAINYKCSSVSLVRKLAMGTIGFVHEVFGQESESSMQSDLIDLFL